MAVLELRDVTKVYGEKTVLSKLNLTIEQGEIVSIFGASGSGKTTLCEIAGGIIQPSHGEILCRGKAAIASRETSLFAELTLLENVKMHLRLYGYDEKTAAELLEQAGIMQFSGAKWDRLNDIKRALGKLCCVVSAEPPLMILDDCTVGLSPRDKDIFNKKAQEFAKKLNCALLIVTGDMGEAGALGKFYVLSGGVLREG